jgi:hypothetical protein
MVLISAITTIAFASLSSGFGVTQRNRSVVSGDDPCAFRVQNVLLSSVYGIIGFQIKRIKPERSALSAEPERGGSIDA